ncbi:outer-membrane lipoprotein carrier protein LolA [Paracraurococcus ruber]|uniref:Outer-membrane lipoprotein carrier protein LolA n=1 Tax=Paracraurococcus ruber TaxID=77675 RepID=A0ABS1D6T2_9PROT|nr:outer-membrane lipoprotein carrier protein LolA [Paracraurococcus ruber]
MALQRTREGLYLAPEAFGVVLAPLAGAGPVRRALQVLGPTLPFTVRLTSLKARFLQIAQNGASAEGTGWIVRPGKMRFEYDPPEPLLLVASYGQFFYFDRQLKQATVLPIGATPLGILMRDDLSLSGDVTVTRVERGGGLLRITLIRAGRAAEGRLTLVFSDDPVELRQWAVVDAQGQETRVTLSQPEYGGRFPNLLFDFNDPRFREQLGIQ